MHTGKGSIDVSDATQESSAIGNTATGSVGSAPFAHHLRGAATPGEAPLVSGFVAKRGSKFPFAWAMRYCEVTVRHHIAHARNTEPFTGLPRVLSCHWQAGVSRRGIAGMQEME